MRRFVVIAMALMLLLFTGCARTEPYEVKYGAHTYVFGPVKGTVTGKGSTCFYEVTILRGVEPKLVLR